MEDVIGFTAVLLIFGSLPAVIIYVVWRRSRERLEMIKSGANPFLYMQYKNWKAGGGDLKAGMIITAIGLALALSASVYDYRFNEDLFTVATILVFVGVAILLYWKLSWKERQREQAFFDRQIERLEEELKINPDGSQPNSIIE